MNLLDRTAEATSRWLAQRHSRRSFLGLTGRVALVAVGGALVADAFTQQAEARVCGQSGVAPKCPTYECGTPNVWGWCWYASPGCCANGGIKKICDCCRADWDFAHGYCPDGHNVYCIMESCLEDPRVITKPVRYFQSDDAVALNLQLIRTRADGSAPTVVIVPSEPLMAAIAMPVAALLSAPLVLLAADGAVPPEVPAELRRLGTKSIVVVAANRSDAPPYGALADVAPLDTTFVASDVAQLSIRVATALHAKTPRRELVVLGAGAPAVQLAACAGAYCAVTGGAVVVSSVALGALRSAELAAANPTATAPRVVVLGDEIGPTSDAERITDEDPRRIAAELARRAVANTTAQLGIAAVPMADGMPLASGIAPPAGVVLLYDVSGLPFAARELIRTQRDRFGGAEVAGRNDHGIDARLDGRGGAASGDQAGDLAMYALQSDLNAFDAHLLMGVAGEGLPVVAQPNEERPIGRARVRGELPTSTTTSIPVVARAARKRRAAPTPPK